MFTMHFKACRVQRVSRFPAKSRDHLKDPKAVINWIHQMPCSIPKLTPEKFLHLLLIPSGPYRPYFNLLVDFLKNLICKDLSHHILSNNELGSAKKTWHFNVRGLVITSKDLSVQNNLVNMIYHCLFMTRNHWPKISHIILIFAKFWTNFGKIMEFHHSLPRR